MIVPMKKVSLLVRLKDTQSTLDALARLGALHIQHQKAPHSPGTEALLQDLSLLNQALNILSASENIPGKFLASKKRLEDWKFIAQHIVDSKKRLERLEEYSRKMLNQIELWKEWGDFNPQKIKGLLEKEVFFGLYTLTLKQLKEFSQEAIVQKISQRRGIVNCAVISRQKLEIPFKEITLPEMGLSQMRQRFKEDRRMADFITEDIRQHICYLEGFLKRKKFLEKELEFQEAAAGIGESGQIGYLVGFAPFDTIGLLQAEAERQSWGLLIEDPADDQEVPTLIRNPRWVSIINPIFKMIEVVPGYREFDISLWVLLFLSIFFGMLIGDAGYGAIFFLLTFLAERKWSKKLQDKSIFPLFYLFSVCAVIWGLFSGTFFGQSWLPTAFKPLLPALRDNKSLQAFCFFLGATHLSIAHLWQALRKAPSLSALSDIGWITILWGAFFLARSLILSDAFPAFGKWFFICGAAFVVLFSSKKKNIFRGIGEGLGNLLLNLVNSFTDVVSYIRLFAVGLASVAVADTFNQIALDIGFNNFFKALATSLILLLGHALNIVLGPMAILVHGIRLNVLEFCNHIDVKWSGFEYKPLRQWR